MKVANAASPPSSIYTGPSKPPSNARLVSHHFMPTWPILASTSYPRGPLKPPNCASPNPHLGVCDLVRFAAHPPTLSPREECRQAIPHMGYWAGTGVYLLMDVVNCGQSRFCVVSVVLTNPTSWLVFHVWFICNGPPLPSGPLCACAFVSQSLTLFVSTT